MYQLKVFLRFSFSFPLLCEPLCELSTMRCDSFVCVSHTSVSWPRKCPRNVLYMWDRRRMGLDWHLKPVQSASRQCKICCSCVCCTLVTRCRLKALQEVTADSCLVIYNLETFFFFLSWPWSSLLLLCLSFGLVCCLCPLPSALGHRYFSGQQLIASVRPKPFNWFGHFF